jgi:hypothetical protein
MDYDNTAVADLAIAIEQLGEDDCRAGTCSVKLFNDLVADLRKAIKAEIVCGKDVFVGEVINGVMFAPNNRPDGHYWIIPKPLEATP